jgi:hypothetical protein
VIVMAFIFLMMLVPPLLVVLVLGFITRRSRPATHLSLVVLSSVLLLTPSFGPATIAVVPAPFGYLFLAGLLGDGWDALISWVMQYPLWHAIAFPLTALLTYLVAKWLRPNNSFKPTPLRGAA